MVSPHPLHFAVVVGITTYPGGYKQLTGPANDARAFAEWLTDESGGGLPPENVTLVTTPELLTTLADARPTKEVIDDALWETTRAARTALAALPEDERSAMRRQTRLYLFAAGHGIMPGTGSTALLDAKAEPAGRKKNLELGSYRDWYVRDGTFGELCFFADCCRTYEMRAISGVPDFDSPLELGGKVHALVGWATEGGQLAFEHVDETVPVDERRGYFSLALVDCLRGAATDPATGYVTAQTLAERVNAQVTALTKDKAPRLRQHIEMPIDMTRAMTFGPRHLVAAAAPTATSPGTAPGRPRHVVTIKFPNSFIAPVEIVAPDGSLTYWEPSTGAWRGFLFDGLYFVQLAGTAAVTTGFDHEGAFEVAGSARDVQL